VSARPFRFRLQLSAETDDDMLLDLANQVLGHLGFDHQAGAEVAGLLHAASSRARIEGSRDVRFDVRGGALEIVLTHANGREWRTTRRLP